MSEKEIVIEADEEEGEDEVTIFEALRARLDVAAGVSAKCLQEFFKAELALSSARTAYDIHVAGQIYNGEPVGSSQSQRDAWIVFRNRKWLNRLTELETTLKEAQHQYRLAEIELLAARAQLRTYEAEARTESYLRHMGALSED